MYAFSSTNVHGLYSLKSNCNSPCKKYRLKKCTSSYVEENFIILHFTEAVSSHTTALY